jgi:GTP-binding protein
MRPLVALVGRPNVGKSTLFNRLVGRRLALVGDEPGVTRDRHYGDAEWHGRSYTLIDTGGFTLSDARSEGELLRAVREQAQLAVEECSAIVFVTDGKSGVASADADIAQFLRKSKKPVLIAVNKLDNPKLAEAQAAEFYRLGMPEVFPISAEHNLGIEALQDKLDEMVPLPEEEEDASDQDAVRIAIVGRPNVGKSTLVNALLKTKRLVATQVPGTTRDAIDSELSYEGRRVVLTDTAGIRRKSVLSQKVEKYAVVSALKAVDRSDVAVLVLDAGEPGVDQDAKIAGVAEEKGRGLLIVVNKWDLLSKDKRREETFRDWLKHRFKFVSYAPIVFTVALTGSKVEKVLSVSAQLWEQFRFRAPTPKLNKLLKHIVDSHPAPLAHGKPLRLYYIAQVSTAPPTFMLTCNRPELVPESYKRYLVNQLREAFGLRVPIHLNFKERPGQARRQSRKRPKRGRS